MKTPAGATYFDRLTSIVDSGVLAELSAGAVRVLMVLLRHADYETGKAWPSIETIAAKTGERNLNRIRKVMKELETHQVVRTIDAGGGKSHPAVRLILTMQTGTESVPVGGPDTGTEAVPLSDSQRGTLSTVKGGQISTQRGTDLSANGDGIRPPNLKNSKNIISNITNADGGDDGEIHSEGEKDKDKIRECQECLKDLGIHQPMRSKIAKIPGMSAALILHVWDEINSLRAINPPGILVKRLNANPAELIAEFAADQNEARLTADARRRIDESRQRLLGELKIIDQQFSKINRDESDGVEAAINEIRELTKSRIYQFTDKLIECEAQRLCGADLIFVCDNVRKHLSREAIRGICSKAFQAKTYHETEWFKQFTEAPTLVGANY
jgi:hypothetical protein